MQMLKKLMRQGQRREDLRSRSFIGSVFYGPIFGLGFFIYYLVAFAVQFCAWQELVVNRDVMDNSSSSKEAQIGLTS